jgi:hypothetical protein
MGRILSVGLCFGVTLLVGCAAGAAVTPPGAPAPASAITQQAAPRLPWQATRLGSPDARHSWMAPEAKERDLLYVSDDTTYDVYVFSYPQGKLVGTLTGFAAPGSLCSDARGDVFIPNVLTSTIVEYAHGSASPIGILNDATQSYPDACAVNPVTGDLAVSNNGSGTGEGRGGIAIYHAAAGDPAFYRAMYHPYSCGYDPKGKLFIDGEDASFDNFQFGVLAGAGRRYRKVVLNQAISLAGGVAWDGARIAVGDVYGAAIYQFSIRGSIGNRVGSTPLTGTVAAWQFEVDGGRVVVPNYDVQHQSGSKILTYDYPSGGAARRAFGSGVVLDPVGATLSRPQ